VSEVPKVVKKNSGAVNSPIAPDSIAKCLWSFNQVIRRILQHKSILPTTFFYIRGCTQKHPQ
jgi:hypothetical protein